MSKVDGGTAFPRIDVEHFPRGYGHGEHCESQSKAGMSLRDYFAGQALTGCVSLMLSSPAPNDPKSAVALWAYEIADAMLVERLKP